MKVTLDKAIKELCTMYGRGITNKYVFKPVSWALYQTWKKIDELEDPRYIITIDGSDNNGTD